MSEYSEFVAVISRIEFVGAGKELFESLTELALLEKLSIIERARALGLHSCYDERMLEQARQTLCGESQGVVLDPGREWVTRLTECEFRHLCDLQRASISILEAEFLRQEDSSTAVDGFWRVQWAKERALIDVVRTLIVYRQGVLLDEDRMYHLMDQIAIQTIGDCQEISDDNPDFLHEVWRTDPTAWWGIQNPNQ